MSASFRIVLRSPLPADLAWSRLFDLRAHDLLIPLTRIAAVPPELTVGTRFVARTALGPFGFDDPMTITAWSPPSGAPPSGRARGAATIVKSGRVIRGQVAVDVQAVIGGCVISWTQQVRLPCGLSRPALPLLRAGYRRTIRRLLSAR